MRLFVLFILSILSKKEIPSHQLAYEDRAHRHNRSHRQIDRIIAGHRLIPIAGSHLPIDKDRRAAGNDLSPVAGGFLKGATLGYMGGNVCGGGANSGGWPPHYLHVLR